MKTQQHSTPTDSTTNNLPYLIRAGQLPILNLPIQNALVYLVDLTVPANFSLSPPDPAYVSGAGRGTCLLAA